MSAFNRTINLLTGLLLSAGFAPISAAQQLADASTVAVYFQKSGLDRQLKELEKTLPGEFASGLSEVPNLSPETRNRADIAVRKTFTAENMSSILRTEIQKNLSNEDLKAVLKFYDLKVAQEIVKADIDTSAREATVRNARMAKLMEDFPKGEPSRWGTFQKLESAASLSDFMAVVMRNMTLAVIRGIGMASGRDTSIEMQAFDDDFRKNASKIKEGLKLPMTLALVDTYAGVSDEALSKYLEMMESPAGRRVTASGTQAFEKMFRALGDALGAAFGEKSTSSSPDESARREALRG